MVASFSHSSLATFENCPRQYRYRYIDRLPRLRVGVEAHMGTAVHAALEGLHRDRKRGLAPSLTDLRQRYQRAWDEVPSRDLRVVRTGFDPEDYRLLGLHCLDTYFQRLPESSASEVIECEQRVDFCLGEKDEHKLVGYLDRLDRAADGAYEIHDYKTSGSLPRPRDLDGDRQLTLYEMGVRRLLPHAGVIRHVWHYLTFGRIFTRQRDAGHLARVKSQTEALISRVQATVEFPVRTGILCHWCDYRDECPEGGAYVQQRRPPGLLRPSQGDGPGQDAGHSAGGGSRT